MKDEPMRLPQMPPTKTDELLVHDSISMSVQAEQHFPERLVRILIALCGSIGVMWCMQGFFDFPIPAKQICLYAVCLTLFLRALRAIWPKFGFGVILVIFGLVPLVLFRHREAASAGMDAIYRIMRRHILWQSVFETSHKMVGGYTELECIRMVCDAAATAVVALLEYSDVLVIHPASAKSGFWIRFLVTFPFLECGLYFGLETHPAAVMMLFLFWLGTIAVMRRRPGRKAAIRQGGSYLLQHSFAVEIEHRYTVHETGAAVMLAGALALALGSMAGTARYVRSEKMLQLRTDLRNFYTNFSMRDVTGLLQKIPSDIGPNIITDEVDLQRIGNPKFDGHTVLHISAGKALPVADYYLRNLTRTDYTGRGWAIQTGIYRNDHDLLESLANGGIMPQTITHSGHLDDYRLPNEKLPVTEMKISALTPQPAGFIPYQALIAPGTKFRYDLDIQLENTRNYAFWLVNCPFPEWDKMSFTSAPSANGTIAEYEAFVQKHYLEVPETDSMDKLREAFRDYSPNPFSPLADRLDTIRDFIWNRAEYTQNPRPTPEERDFAEYFINESHEGYCAHYATAGILLCRMNGIPARYVQGYVIPEGVFPAAVSGDNYEIDVQDAQAHAWAEIYVNGYGWVPYEFTESVMDSWHIPREPASTTAPVTTPAPQSTDSSDGTTRTTVSSTTEASGSTTETTGTTATEPPAERNTHSILWVIFSVGGIGILWLAWHNGVLRRRKSAMHSQDPNLAADAAYNFMIQLLHYQHIRQEKRTHEDFSTLAEEHCRLLPEGEITRVIGIQQAVAFSRTGISKDEAEFVVGAAQKMAQNLYAQSRPLKRFLLKWILHIV